MRRIVRMLGAVLGLAVSATSLKAQTDQSWQRKWYWGAQAGTFLFKTNTQTKLNFALFDAGGHWMITGKRSALYLAYDQVRFKNGTSAAISDPTAPGGVRLVTFTQARRIQTMLLAVPTDQQIQVYAGGGFAIQQVINANPQGPFGTPAEANAAAAAVNDVDTKAFVVFGGGVQYRKDRLAIFGQYQFTPGSKSFLITSATHALTGGVRYALTSSHEEVTSGQH